MIIKTPVYLDYAATTPVDPKVAKIMMQYLTMDGCFANPASNTHECGLQAKSAVELARKQVADLINAHPKEIIWTSGATEADNLAIIGIMNFYSKAGYKNKGKHLITVKTEHKAVLDPCKFLESNGFNVTYLAPQTNGLINLTELEAAIQPDTILISVMHVNNETGVIQDIYAIGEICRRHKVFFHVDAAQSAGKIPLDLQALPIDLMSFSAHKMYGPKGVGALYVRRKPKVRLQPLIYGGGHEQGLRSGTLAPHQIIGMSAAFAIAVEMQAAEAIRILQLRQLLVKQLEILPDIYVNGDQTHTIPGILNISFAGVDGVSLLYALKDLALSTGSACTSTDIMPSYVLQAMRIPAHLAHSTLRISIGRYTSEKEIEFAAKQIIQRVEWLRNMAPKIIASSHV